VEAKASDERMMKQRNKNGGDPALDRCRQTHKLHTTDRENFRHLNSTIVFKPRAKHAGRKWAIEHKEISLAHPLPLSFELCGVWCVSVACAFLSNQGVKFASLCMKRHWKKMMPAV
jgi:hypothetical protein